LQNGEGPVNNTVNQEPVYPLPKAVSSVSF
jgi:hypothetical protein